MLLLVFYLVLNRGKRLFFYPLIYCDGVTHANRICSSELLIRFKFLQVKQVDSSRLRRSLYNSGDTNVADLWQVYALPSSEKGEEGDILHHYY